MLWLLRPTVKVTAVSALEFSTKPTPERPPMALLKPLRRSTPGVAPWGERMWVEFKLNAPVAPERRIIPGKLVVPA